MTALMLVKHAAEHAMTRHTKGQLVTQAPLLR